ncbi:MAG: pilus assembly protein PilM [Oscillospiraceae bacterium]|nr:pilus assembly protein PilM [Oscillospiraceae bacterium]
MLSFDVTDRNIRIIKGQENNGKVRIQSAATLELEEDIIVNGHCKDIPRLATLINQTLRTNKMGDKEAIISISSNLTIFKEITVPKAKEPEFSRLVKNKMQSTMGIDDSYGVSYIIVGDVEDEENGAIVTKVLATACPFDVVDCYRKVFTMLGIALKSVIVGCNCITRVLLSDEKNKSRMPLLAVQIDNNFINLNLYEEGQLTFSRFASIDPADYDDSEDYVFEAVNENIYRMLQFQRNRNRSNPIENVVFYGDTREYVRLTNALDQMEISGSVIGVPRQVSGYENIEFAVYANAVGAMFRRNKETEHINLLETMEFGSLVADKIKSDRSFPFIFFGSVGFSAAVILIWYLIVANKNAKIVDEIEEIDEEINGANSKIALLNQLNTVKASIDNYATMIDDAYCAYESKPILDSEVYTKVNNTVEAYCDEEYYTEQYQKQKEELLAQLTEDPNLEYATLDAHDQGITGFTYSNGTISLTISLPGDKELNAQRVGYQLVNDIQALTFDETGEPMFVDVVYTGYSVTEESDAVAEEEGTAAEGEAPTVATDEEAEERMWVDFNLTLTMDSPWDPNAETTEEAAQQPAE